MLIGSCIQGLYTSLSDSYRIGYFKLSVYWYGFEM